MVNTIFTKHRPPADLNTYRAYNLQNQILLSNDNSSLLVCCSSLLSSPLLAIFKLLVFFVNSYRLFFYIMNLLRVNVSFSQDLNSLDLPIILSSSSPHGYT